AGVLKYMSVKQREITQKILEESDNLIEALYILFDITSEHFEKMSPAFRLDMKKYHLEMMKTLEESNELPYFKNNEVIIERGIKEGLFRKDIDVRIINRCMLEVAKMTGDKEIFPPDDFSGSEVVRNVYFNYLRGLCTQKGLDLIDYYEKQYKKQTNILHGLKDKANSMKNKFLTAIAVLLFPAATAIAQGNDGDLKLSLKEAQDYAIQNNRQVMSAKLDVLASKAAIWETISAALPQLNLSGSVMDNLKLTTTLLPGEFFGQPGIKVPVTFGSQFNSSASAEASLLLFNAQLYVGIETTKLAHKLNSQSLEKTELDTRESVASAYYLILVSEESLKLIDANLLNLNETLKATRAMFSAGMAEATDVDQMLSNVSMLENNKSSLQRTIEVNYNLLRFILGTDADTRIILTETLENFTGTVNVESLLAQEFNISSNVSYRLIEGQEMLSKLALKNEKASVLPTLAGFYSYGTNGMGDKLSDLRWFQNSMLGVQVSVPIFASGQRYSGIKKAQINYRKAETTKEMVREQLLIQEKQLRYNLVNADQQYKTQKQNVEVSQRVYKSTENKYKQGMASSLELTQANTQFLQAQNNYISALMNLLQTKLALDKLLNNIN
ncbi:MAG TPA: TolC family protein, partial [Bacteroidales bacterium]|nr:TolC family protein [Bacteroidales bacterium]